MPTAKYFDTVTDQFGNAQAGASVAVYLTGTLTSAPLFAADGTTPIANPVTTATNGEFEFLVEAGTYDIVATFAAITATQDAVVIGGAGGGFVTLAGTETLTNKTLSLTSNTLTGTKAQFNTALSDGDFTYEADLAASSGSSLVGFLQSGTGAVARTAQAKMRDVVSVQDYSTPAVADALATTIYTPTTTTSTVATGAALDSLYWGPAQVTTADGNKRGKFFSQIKAAPSSLGNYNSVDTTFNGDWSKSHFSIEHRITGAATLGQPATGYLYTPEAYPHFTYLFNSSGHNEALDGNEGRTSAVAHRVVVSQAGQGDAMCFNGSGFVQGTKAGSTHFLANPAVALFAGDCAAGTDGTYLNPYETILNDNGFDVAAIGAVYNFNRTNATGAKSTYWGGERFQNIGSAICDNVIAATGKWAVGLDFAMSSTDFGANQAAISLKTTQRIYFNNGSAASGSLEAGWRSTIFSGDYISHSGSAISIVVGGNPTVQVSSSQMTVAGSNGISIASTGLLRFAGTSQYGTGTSTATFTATNKPGAATAVGPTQWLTVVLGGTSYQIPCWAT